MISKQVVYGAGLCAVLVGTPLMAQEPHYYDPVAATKPLNQTLETDICIYGGTSAGVAAAVQASRMGKKAIILEQNLHLGGMSSGGLGETDIGNKAAIGGVSHEFYKRVGQKYGVAENWKFEPHIAEEVFNDLVKESGTTVFYRQFLKAVEKNGVRLVSVTMESGLKVKAKQFVDCTYEGDLLAKAGVKYHVGREANAVYNETVNGVQVRNAHQFDRAVSPYIVEGDANSGLLPGINPGDPGEQGSGDNRVQAYNFRLCLTTVPENQIPYEKPAGYNPQEYVLLTRLLNAGWPESQVFGKFDKIANNKVDKNNHGAISTDFIGRNYTWPEADYATREKMFQQHVTYQKGLMWFLGNDPSISESIRTKWNGWGLPKDEFQDSGGWPFQLYVREGRRMISDYVMNEANCRGKAVVEDPISLAAYTMDSHNCQRFVKDGNVRNEGDVQVGGFPPYPISFRSIVPKKAECENLTVPVCLSTSHIAYGSIRMEPVFMILAQSAATAAAMAIDNNSAVQDVDYPKLREKLVADGQILEWQGKGGDNDQALAPRILNGILADDEKAKKTGEWVLSTRREYRVGTGYVHDDNARKGELSIAFAPEIPEAGEYEIFFVFTPNTNRASNVPVVVNINGQDVKAISVNQKPPGEGIVSLGKFTLPQGTATTVTISNKDTDGYVVVDGVQAVKAN